MAESSIQGFKVIVGLGNPGRAYAMTRHNLGFLVVDAFALELGGSFTRQRRFEASVAQVRIDSQAVDLIKPETYMNASGESIAKFAAYYKVLPEEILVVVDDMALPFGKMRLKTRGSSGGHNGLQSIQECLATECFPRLRIGIGKALYSYSDHVLGSFTVEEQQLLPEIVARAKKSIHRLYFESFERVSQDLNKETKDEGT